MFCLIAAVHLVLFNSAIVLDTNDSNSMCGEDDWCPFDALCKMSLIILLCSCVSVCVCTCQQVSQVDDEFKSRASAYSSITNSLHSLERKAE